jgi:WD40 repeat protein
MGTFGSVHSLAYITFGNTEGLIAANFTGVFFWRNPCDFDYNSNFTLENEDNCFVLIESPDVNIVSFSICQRFEHLITITFRGIDAQFSKIYIIVSRHNILELKDINTIANVFQAGMSRSVSSYLPLSNSIRKGNYKKNFFKVFACGDDKTHKIRVFDLDSPQIPFTILPLNSTAEIRDVKICHGGSDYLAVVTSNQFIIYEWKVN